MIVKILSSSSSFKGVRYNTNKIDSNKGELLKVVNFGTLQGLQKVRPEDYVNHLKMISAQNRGIKSPQFHVAISTKGRNHTKEELTVIAEKWLDKMGYRQQPYLLIFHHDTKNNHVHIVSTRVGLDGVKISSAFEKNRAVQNLNQVIGLDENLQAKKDIEKALEFNFSTKAQFLMILESKNYSIGGDSKSIALIKYGKVVGEFDAALISSRIEELVSSHHNGTQISQKDLRRNQLVAIFHKYLKEYPSELYRKTIPLAGGREKLLSEYSSSFADVIRDKLGIELIFHAADGLQPYGYSVIDHNKQNVFKGGEIMDIKELLSYHLAKPNDRDLSVEEILGSSEQLTSNRGIASENSPINANIIDQDQAHLTDLSYDNESSTYECADSNTEPMPLSSYNENEVLSADDYFSYSTDISVNIADDVDDEAILGRNRRRQKKARTNTR